MNQQEIQQQVKAYYDDKLAAFGPTPQGVDWNGEASQQLRFEQLSKLINPSESFSLLDYGCGYGAMYDFLENQYGNQLTYFGYDLSEEMIEAAQKSYPEGPVFSNERPTEPVDYVVASGIFNVRMEIDDASWKTYIQDTLAEMNAWAKKGFAFNILTAYSDPPYQKDYLFYAQPEEWFQYCKLNFSSQVALLHDYPLFEFCLVIRK